jgi:hypothetical protein
MNGDDGDHDRASPEINSQEQMAAQRASGGVVIALFLLESLLKLLFSYIDHLVIMY